MRALLGDMGELVVTSYLDSMGLLWGTEAENVDEMRYHSPEGEGDRHFIDVYFKDGTTTRVFNAENVYFSKNEKSRLRKPACLLGFESRILQ